MSQTSQTITAFTFHPTELEKQEEERLYQTEMRAARAFARSERGGEENSMAHAIHESVRGVIACRSGFAYNAWQRAYQEERTRLAATEGGAACGEHIVVSV